MCPMNTPSVGVYFYFGAWCMGTWALCWRYILLTRCSKMGTYSFWGEWSLVVQADCWCILLYSLLSSLVVMASLWGDYDGDLWGKRSVGAFYTGIPIPPSGESPSVGARMVSGGVYGLMAYFAVI